MFILDTIECCPHAISMLSVTSVLCKEYVREFDKPLKALLKF